jgi:hypothetical protein
MPDLSTIPKFLLFHAFVVDFRAYVPDSHFEAYVMSQWFNTFILVYAYVSYHFIIVPGHSMRSCFEHLPILHYQCTVALFIFEYLVLGDAS